MTRKYRTTKVEEAANPEVLKEGTAEEKLEETEKTQEETKVDKTEDIIVPEKQNVVCTGIVNKECQTLNVRAAATVNSNAIGLIATGSVVQICLDESTDDFYSVCTKNGVNGFCMKRFITIM